jgi:hypothetical protein
MRGTPGGKCRRTGQPRHSLYHLGIAYINGNGVGQDSAGQGNALAQYNLGAMYARGQGVPQDFAQAFDWFGKAADHGNADAQVSLGELYAEGYGVPQDYTQAPMCEFILTGIPVGAPIAGFSPGSRLGRKPEIPPRASVPQSVFDRRQSSPGSP